MDQDLKNSTVSTGTTILGIVCKDGIVMAGDRRSSVGRTIYSKNSEKVQIINDYLVFSGCGSAAEIQKVSHLLRAELKLKELKSKNRPTVKQAASLLSNIRVSGSAFIVAGFDEDGTFSLYDVLGNYCDKIEDFTASVGSGMPFALGLLERQYKPGMSIHDGIELAKESIKSSIQRDSGSGNGIDICAITKDGIKKVVEQTLESNFKDDKRQ